MTSRDTLALEVREHRQQGGSGSEVDMALKADIRHRGGWGIRGVERFWVDRHGEPPCSSGFRSPDRAGSASLVADDTTLEVGQTVGANG